MTAAPLATAELKAVGWGYRLKEQPTLAPVPKDSPRELLRDPANAHDKNAIKVLHAGTSIGFVERAAAGLLAPLVAAGSLRFDARCLGLVNARQGHSVLLRVYARGSTADVPASAKAALADLAARYPPPQAQPPAAMAALRGKPDAEGWVHLPRDADPSAWVAANKPSSFGHSEIAWLHASAPGRAAGNLPRCGKWCVRTQKLHCPVARF